MTQQAQQVLPNLYVDSVDEMRKHYLEKLGFEHMMGMVGRDGALDFCIVTLHGASLMLSRPMKPIEGSAPKPSTQRLLELYFSVPDVDAHHAELVKRKVEIVERLTTQWWGDRNFAVLDPYGYKVWFFQTVGELNPPPGVKIV